MSYEAPCFLAYGPLELGPRQRDPEHRPARLQHPARSQAFQADWVIADPVDQARDRGDRRGIVARDPGCPPVRGSSRPRSVLKLVVADVIERLDHGRTS